MVDGYEISWQKITFPLRSALFSPLFFLFIYLWVDTKLIYFHQEQYLLKHIYVSSMHLFSDTPLFPGKPIEYVCAILSHYFYYSWAGAVIVTAIGWMLCLVTDRVITFMAGDQLRPLRFCLPIILLIEYSRYYHHLQDSLSILFALIFIYLYTRKPLRNPALRFALFLLLSTAVYIVAAKAYLIFVAVCAIFEFFNMRNPLTGCLSLLPPFLIPYLASNTFFDMSTSQAYLSMSPFSPASNIGTISLRFCFFLFLPTAALIGAIVKIAGHNSSFEKAQKLLDRCRENKFKWYIETATLIVIAATAVWFAKTPVTKTLRRIDYFCQNKMWQQLLDETDQLPEKQYSVFVCHDVYRALYHSGRLLDELFSYPPHPAGLMLNLEDGLSGETQLTRWFKLGDILYELGDINRAENATYEALTSANYYPQGLMRLAMINIVKQQPETARIFLNALSADFIYRDWAKEYLKRLEEYPYFSTDDEIQRTRSLMFVNDSIERTTPVDLLKTNKNNKMAFEYVVAALLLGGQHLPLVSSIHDLDNYDYPKDWLPRHLQEAVLTVMTLTGKKVDLGTRRMDGNVVSRYRSFIEHLKDFAQDPEGTKNILEEDFSDTYYYYYFSRFPR